MATIDLPTLLQRVRVDTSDMRRAEKEAGDFEAAMRGSADRTSGSADDLADSLGGVGDAAQGMGDEADDAAKKVKKVGSASKDAKAGVDDLGDSLGTAGRKARGAASGITDLDDSLRRTRSGAREADADFRLLGGSGGALGNSFKGLAKSGGALPGLLVGKLKIPAIALAAQLAAGAVAALSAGLLAFSAQIGPVVGVVGALPAALGAFVSVSKVFKLATEGATEAANAVEKYGKDSKQAKEALAKLTPEARAFASTLGELKAEKKTLASIAEVGALPGFAQGLKGVQALLPSVRDGVAGVALAMGDTAAEVGGMIGSGPFAKDFATIVSRNTTLVATLGKALTPIVTILKNIMLAAGPMTQMLAEAFTGGAGGLAAYTSNIARMEGFFNRAGQVLLTLIGTLKDFGIGLKNVAVIANKGLGIDMLGNLRESAEGFREMTTSAEGVAKIQKFFEDARPALHETALLIRDIFKAFFGLADDQELAPLISQIRTELLPSLIALAEGVGKNIGPALIDLATAWVDFQKVLSFNPFITVAGGFANLLSAITGLISAVPGLGTVVATFIAIGTASKFLAFGAKVTGITSLVSTLSAIGPAGKAGATGLAGFVQGLRGIDASAAGSATIANKIGAGLTSLPGKMRQAGANAASAFSTGFSKAASGASSLGSKVTSGIGKAATGARAAGMRVGTAVVSGVSAGMRGLAGAASAGFAKLGGLLKVIAGGFKVAAVAARAFTLALLTNPIFLIIAAIVALIAGIVLLWKNSETFRNIVIGAWNAVKAAVMAVVNWFQNTVWPVMQAVWNAVATAFRVAVALITGYIKIWWTVVSTVVKAIVAYVTTYFQVLWTVIQTVWNAITLVITTAWNVIKAVVTTAITIVRTVIETAFNVIRTIITTVLNVIRAIFTGHWSEIPRIVGEGIGKVLGLVRELPGKVLSALGNLGRVLFDAGANLIKGLIDGIRSMFGKLGDIAKQAVQKVRDLWPFSPAKDGPLKSKPMDKAGVTMMTQLATGIQQGEQVAVAATAGVAGRVRGFFPSSIPDEGPMRRKPLKKSGKETTRQYASGLHAGQKGVRRAANGVARAASANVRNDRKNNPVKRITEQQEFALQRTMRAQEIVRKAQASNAAKSKAAAVAAAKKPAGVARAAIAGVGSGIASTTADEAVGAGGQITDNSGQVINNNQRTYYITINETRGPTTVDSLIRRLKEQEAAGVAG